MDSAAIDRVMHIARNAPRLAPSIGDDAYRRFARGVRFARFAGLPLEHADEPDVRARARHVSEELVGAFTGTLSGPAVRGGESTAPAGFTCAGRSPSPT